MIKNKYFKNKPITGGNVKKLDGRGPPCNPVQDPLAPTTPSRILLCGPYGCGKTSIKHISSRKTVNLEMKLIYESESGTM